MTSQPARSDALPAVGISFEGWPSTLFESVAPLVDVVEVVPDTFVSAYSDIVDDRTFVVVDEYAPHADLAYHGIGLSIGTAVGWNDAYLRLLEQLWEFRPPRWHSEHLGFTFVDDHYLGAMVAAAATIEVADLMIERADAIRRRFGIEFLLEHVASPLARSDEMSAAAFLTAVAQGSGCGLILDLHNLECDEDNGRLRVDEFLAELDLRFVKEIHVAGGVWRDGYHLDVHARLPAPSTMTLLEATVPRCPNVELVVFEILGTELAAVERDQLVAFMRDLRRRIAVTRVAG
jgi:uncharacterized protein (UPF0276 family)